MPYETLKPGSSGPAIVELQEFLTELGYGGPGEGLGKPDGNYGPRTEKAVSAFQAAAGLAVDGLAGPDTRRAIDEADASGALLRRGLAVRRAQSIMARNGYDLSVDGTYGPSSEGAVKVLQEKHGLTVDGVVGEATWKAISSMA